jgi:ABC-type multidrug transport system fused ATPase/permease subunit
MELSNFNSLFEIFCTIYLAYIIGDNFSESNFIALITEKILRKYETIYQLISEINGKILSLETSLNNIKIPDATNEETIKLKTLLENDKKLLETEKEKIEQSAKEINNEIKKSYQTKSFSYIALYLALYCMLILLFAGITQGNTTYKYNNILFCFDIITFIFLMVGWLYDMVNKNWVHSLIRNISKIFLVNGYKFTFITIFLNAIISIICGFISVYTNFHFNFNNALILCTIFLPVLNFIIYFVKSANRANLINKSLAEKVAVINDTLTEKLKRIEDTIIYFKIKDKMEIG